MIKRGCYPLPDRSATYPFSPAREGEGILFFGA